MKRLTETQKILIHQITYETSQNIVCADCEFINGNERSRISMLISHTDLNRIMAKLYADNLLPEDNCFTTFKLEDGTEFIELNFNEVIGHSATLDEFVFNDNVTRIRA